MGQNGVVRVLGVLLVFARLTSSNLRHFPGSVAATGPSLQCTSSEVGNHNRASRPHHQPFRSPVLFPCLRIRGGADSQLSVPGTLSSKDFADPRITDALAKEDEFSQCGVRGMSDLVSTKIKDLTEKKKRRKLTPEEGDLYNVLQMQERIEQSPKLRKRYNGSTAIQSELSSIDAQLSLFAQRGDLEVTEEQSKALEKLERKRQVLQRLEEELALEARYKEVKEVLRDEDGQPIFNVANHSRWLDVMADDRMDDVDRWELGLHQGETSRYTTAWSKTFKGNTLHLETKQTVCRSALPPADAFMGSARAETPLPTTGVHYFEIIPRLLCGGAGESLYGGTYIGLVDGNVTNFNGCWELESHLPIVDEEREGIQINRRAHIMALHDACLSTKGQVTWSGGVRTDWLEGASYGQGDRIGVLVNMDTRTVNLYKNGQFLGKAWGDLPDEVYPFVTLSQPDASAEITFPRFESEIAREQRQSALYLDFLASQPPKPPPLPPLEYMIRNTLEYKEPVIKEIKKAIRYLKRELQGARWDLNTAGVWIRLHKARWSLWVLGVRGPPVTKFVNGEDEKLVMRGDGNSPPRTEEEDAAFMRTDAARELVALGDEEAGLGALLEDGTKRKQAKKAKKAKKSSLPWSAFRKQQKELRREGARRQRNVEREDEKRRLDLKRAGRPDDAVIQPVWSKSKASLKGSGLPTARAANNPRRAQKEMEQRIKKLTQP